MASHAIPFSLAWLRRARRGDVAHHHRHERADAYRFRFYQYRRRCASLRHARGHVSQSGHPRRRHRRSLNDVPSTGMEWPEFKEQFARFREAITLIRQALDRGAE